MIQAIAFYKNDWSKAKAAKWIKSHGYKQNMAKETKSMIHYIQEEPSKFSGFISKVLTSKGRPIIITIGRGLTHDDFTDHPLTSSSESQSAGSGIIDKRIVPLAESNRAMDHDRVSINDSTSTSIANANSPFPEFPDDSLLGYMMKPKSRGGMGFPFPSSASIFTP